MFDKLKNLYEAEYVLDSIYNLSTLNEGDSIATVRDTGYGVRCAKLKGGTLPPGFSLDGSSGAIVLTDPVAAKTPGSGVQAGPYALEIATFDFSGGCTWHQVNINFQVGVPSTLTEGTLHGHIGDYTSTTAPLYVFNDGDGLLDVQLKDGTELAPGLHFYRSATPGQMEIRVKTPGDLQMGSYPLSVCAVDVLGYQTPFTLTLEFKDEHLAELTWDLSRPISDYESASIGSPIRLAEITDPDDNGVVSLALRRINGSVLNPADLGLATVITNNSPKTAEIRVIDGPLFSSKISSDFFSDEQTHVFPLVVETQDGKGAKLDLETQITLHETVKTDNRVMPPAYLKTYEVGDSLAIISGTTGGKIVGFAEPSTNYLTNLGLSAEVDQGILIVKVGSPLTTFQDLDGHGWTESDTENLRTLAINLNVTDTAGNVLPVNVDLGVTDITATRLAVPTEPKALSEYEAGDVLGRIYDLVPGAISNPVALSPSDLASIGLDLVIEQIDGVDGAAALVVANPTLFATKTPVEFPLSANNYSRTFTIRATHSVTGTEDSELEVFASAQNDDSPPQVVLPDPRSADVYQSGDLVASIIEVIDGGIAEIEITSDESLTDLGLNLSIDNKRIARLTVADRETFLTALSDHFTLENGQYIYTLEASVKDMMKGLADVTIDLIIGSANHEALVALDKAKYKEFYTESGEVLASVTDTQDGGIVTATTDNILLSLLSVNMTIEEGGIVRFRVNDPAAFRAAVNEPTYSLIPGFYRVPLDVTTIDGEGGQSVSEVFIYVKSDEFVDTPAVIEDQPTNLKLADVVAGLPLITFSDADGKLDPTKAVLKDAQGVPVAIETLGLAFVPNPLDSNHLDLTVGSNTGDEADFIAALGNGFSRDFTVCLYDPWDLETVLSFTLSLASDEAAVPVVQHDPPEHENKLADSAVLFEFQDPDNTPVGITSLAPGNNAFSLAEVGLQITADENLAILTQTDFQARLHASDSEWSYDGSTNHYSLPVEVITTDQNGNTTTLTVTAKVRKDIESQAIEDFATPVHQSTYPSGGRLFAFTDEDNGSVSANITTLTEAPGNGFSLSEAGLSINSSQEIVLPTNLNTWYGQLKSSPYTQVGNEYRLSFTVTTIDDCNGETDHNLLLRVLADRPADWVLPHPDPKNVDAYRDSDILATIEDLDGITYPGNGANPSVRVYRADGSEVSNPSSVGLLITQLDPNRVEVKVADASEYLASTGTSANYRFDVVDDEGGFTSLDITFTTLADDESHAVGELKHQAEYIGGEEVITFLDDETVTGVVVNSPSLSDLGLTVNGGALHIISSADDWQNGLKAPTYQEVVIDNRTRYRATINVTTTDLAGGQSTYDFFFDVYKDRPAYITSGDAGISKNIDAFGDQEEILTVQDSDGIGAPFTDTLQWFKVVGQTETLLDPADIGLQFFVANAIAIRLRIVDLDLFKQNHNGRTDYRLKVTDTKGGKTDLDFYIEARPDTDSRETVITKHEMLYQEDELVISFSDADGAVTIDVDGNLLDSMVLTTDGAAIYIDGNPNLWRSALGAAPYGDDPDEPDLYYLAQIPVTTTDSTGGESSYTVDFKIVKDQKANIITPTGPPRNADSYKTGDLLLTFNDADGIEYDPNTNPDVLTLKLASDGTFLDPGPDAGLVFVNTGSLIEVRIANQSVFLDKTGSNITYQVDVEDRFQGESSITFSLGVVADSEAIPDPQTKHERAYGEFSDAVLFSDDNGLAGLSIVSPDLSTLGLVKDGLKIRLSGDNDHFRSFLNTAAYTETPVGNNVYYRAEITVNTTDNSGGTSTLTFDFDVLKDREPRIFGSSTVILNEDQFQNFQELILLDDRDGITFNPSTNVGGLKLYRVGDPSGIPIVPNSLGLGFQTINAIAFRLRIDGLDTFKANHAGAVDYRLEVTDNQTGTGNLFFTLGVTPDNELEVDLTPKHEFEFGNTDAVLSFSDAETLLTLEIDSELLDDLGLVQDGFDIRIPGDAALWRNNNLPSANYTLVGTPPDQYYQASIPVLSEDEAGGITDTTIIFSVKKDQKAKIITGPVSPRNQDNYQDGNILMTFGDTDRVHYPSDPTSIVLLNVDGVPIGNPAGIGLRFEKASDSVFQLRIASAATYTANHLTSQGYQIQVKDTFEAFSSFSFSLSVLRDNELQGVPLRKHENAYTLSDNIISFSDSDGLDTLSINATLLSNFGLELVGYNVKIKDSVQNFHNRLANYTLQGTAPNQQYRAEIPVTSTDSQGGQSTQTITFLVDKDKAATAVPNTLVAKNESEYKTGDAIVHFYDADNSGANNSANVSTLTWTSSFSAASVGLQVVGAEIRVSSAAALQTAFRNPDSDYTYAGGQFRLTFTVRTIDQFGGSTDHSIDFQAIHEQRPATVSPSALPEKSETDYSDNEVILTFRDQDNPGPDFKLTTLVWGNSFTPEEAGMWINDDQNLEILTQSEFRAALRVPGGPYNFNQGAGQFELTLNFAAEDRFGGSTPFTNMALKVNLESIDSVAVPGNNLTSKFEDQFGTNETIVHFYDGDNPGAVNSANVSSLTWLSPLSPGDVGLKIAGAAVQVISRTALETALRVSGSQYSHDNGQFTLVFRVRSFDQYGGSKDHNITFLVDHREKDAQANPSSLPKLAENSYGDNAQLLSFTDQDNPGPGFNVTNLVWTSSFSLAAAGMQIDNSTKTLRLLDNATFRQAMRAGGPYTYDSGKGEYSLTIDVKTVDQFGGETPFSMLFTVSEADLESRAIPPMLTPKSEDDYNNQEVIVHFYDADNPGATDSANVSSLTWTSGFSAASLGLEIAGATIRVISTTALHDALRSADSEYDYSGGQFEVSFSVRTTDQFGGTTNHPITFSVIHQPEQATASPTSIPRQTELEYSDYDVLLTFNDGDNPGSGHNITDLRWPTSNSFSLAQAGLRIDTSKRLTILTVNELRNALRDADTPYSYNQGTNEFILSMDLQTVDKFGGITPFNNIPLIIQLVDRPATQDPLSILVKSEAAYSNNEVIASFNDSDNLGSGHNVPNVSWGVNSFTPAQAGVQILVNGQLAILSQSVFRAALRAQNKPYSYTSNNNQHNIDINLVTTDRFGNTTQFEVNFAVTHVGSDSVKTPSSIPTQPQGVWTTGTVLHTFTDADNPAGVPLTVSWASGSIPINSTGLIISGNQLVIKSTNEFSTALTALDSPYNFDTDTKRFTLNFNIATTDQFGSTTGHAISFSVIGDQAGSSYGELGTKILGYHNQTTVFISFTDPDGPLDPSAAVLYAASDTDEPLILANEGFEWAQNGNDLDLRVLSSNINLWHSRFGSATSKNFVAAITDPLGGTTSHPFTISFATSDRPAGADVVTKHEMDYDNEAANDLPIISFNDEDGIESVSYIGSPALSTLGMELNGNEVTITSLTTFQNKIGSTPYTVDGVYYKATLQFRVIDTIGVTLTLPVDFRVIADRKPTVSPNSLTLNESDVVNNKVLFIFSDPDGALIESSAALTNSSGGVLNQANEGLKIETNPSNSSQLRLKITVASTFLSRLGGAGSSKTFGARLIDVYGATNTTPNYNIAVTASSVPPKEREPIPDSNPIDFYRATYVVTTIEYEAGSLELAQTLLKDTDGIPLIAADHGIKFVRNADGEAIDLTVSDAVGGPQSFTDAFLGKTEKSYTIEVVDFEGNAFDVEITIEGEEPTKEPIFSVNEGKDKEDYSETEYLVLVSDDFSGGIGEFQAMSPSEEDLNAFGLEFNQDTKPLGRLELRIAEGRLEVFKNSMNVDGPWIQTGGGWQYAFRFGFVDGEGEPGQFNQILTILDGNSDGGKR